MNMEAPSPTIHTKTYPGAGPYVIERGDGYYALSVEEAARLQSFPAFVRIPMHHNYGPPPHRERRTLPTCISSSFLHHSRAAVAAMKAT